MAWGRGRRGSGRLMAVVGIADFESPHPPLTKQYYANWSIFRLQIRLID